MIASIAHVRDVMIASIAHVRDVIGMLWVTADCFSRLAIVLESSILESSMEKV
jgi:hypothetical protein